MSEQEKNTLPNNDVSGEVSQLTDMQKFVYQFMAIRKNQNSKFAGKKMSGFYIQSLRFDRLREYVSRTFTGAHIMSKSEQMDFMLYLLENFLAKQYGDLEVFNDFYNRENGIDTETAENMKTWRK